MNASKNSGLYTNNLNDREYAKELPEFEPRVAEATQLE